jgi:hypothetical protein
MDSNTVDLFREDTWKHLIIPYDELTDEQKDAVFYHHAATGGDMIFLTNGEVLYV